MEEMIKMFGTLTGVVAGFLWGSPDETLVALIALMAIDYISGIMAAFKEKKISSSTGLAGFLKKMGILFIVAIGHLLDHYILKLDVASFRSIVIFYYCANEGISILENAGRLGLPIPAKLKEAFSQLQTETSYEDDVQRIIEIGNNYTSYTKHELLNAIEEVKDIRQYFAEDSFEFQACCSLLENIENYYGRMYKND